MSNIQSDRDVISGHRFPYNWKLSEATFAKDKGTVFSCFACGGGSTMGYKLAGFDVIGCNEIDPRVFEIYDANHHPRISHVCDIRELVRKAKAGELEPELYHLDVLDGSPPCSTFSTAGLREKAWGVEKKFKEGQAKQVLDTLFFDFIELANELRPKVVVAENVMGILKGNAKKYVTRIYEELGKAGYSVCHRIVKGWCCGVPQTRERVFFIAVRKDLLPYIPTEGDLFEVRPKVEIEQGEEPILFGDFHIKGDVLPSDRGEEMRMLWSKRIKSDMNFGDITLRVQGKEKYFGLMIWHLNKVCSTITTSQRPALYDYDELSYASERDLLLCSSFPLDYNTLGKSALFVCAMSVPPVMMAHVSSAVYEQILKPIKQRNNG